ncbi:toll/interleukin-1 receptor domain-containing protein [Porphyromonas pasteri]|nr:toll/interleukin-1 receptor domain-containing protein [Porphyromonas pasteri]
MKGKIRMSMELSKVYISYKHDSKYDGELDSIKKGLQNNGIGFSIDQTSLGYKDDIEEYEKEIGQADRVIMIITPGYFKSLACMFEMTQIFKHGRVEERVFPIVDMGYIPRNGDGLSQIKKFWQSEKKKKAQELAKESGNSRFRITEIKKIDNIICQLDDLWQFIVHVNTGSIDELTKDDAAMLIVALKKSLPTPLVDREMNGSSLMSADTKPTTPRAVSQYGDKSIYIENNSGDIIIN